MTLPDHTIEQESLARTLDADIHSKIMFTGHHLLTVGELEGTSTTREDHLQAARFVRWHLQAALRSMSELKGLIEDLEKVCIMTNKYRWHGMGISKSDHLRFSWFQFLNHCYLLETKTKHLLNRATEACGYFRVRIESDETSRQLKKLDKGLKKYIQSRGQHVHEWNETNFSIDTLKIVETLDSILFGQSEFDPRSHYFGSKAIVLADMSAAHEFASAYVDELLNEVGTKLLEATLLFGKFCKKFGIFAIHDGNLVLPLEIDGAA